MAYNESSARRIRQAFAHRRGITEKKMFGGVGFVPSRAVELLDYTENILGVAAGTGISWLAHRLIERRRAAPTPVTDLEQ